jgi:acetoacetyl-CoA synthetase
MAPHKPGPIWTPPPEAPAEPHVARFATWCITNGKADIGPDYESLWRWSTDHLEDFWAALWEYFDVRSPTGYDAVLRGTTMPNVRWFTGSRVNYVEHLFRGRNDQATAILDVREGRHGDEEPVHRSISWGQFRANVAAFAHTLTDLGVVAGDRVVGYVPNAYEAVVAFLGCATIGGIWSGCGQDYGAPAAADRFAQLEPVVLIAADGYRYGGKVIDRRGAITDLLSQLPTVRATIVFSRLGLDLSDLDIGGMGELIDWDAATGADVELSPVALDFDHPLWVLFSSGTTGRPKGIVHGQGGVLLEHLKAMSLNLNLGPEDTFFWYTSPSWMVWNYLVSALLVGATIVCYDGSPTHPAPDILWALAAQHHVTLLGTSPAHLRMSAQAGLEPAQDHDLSALSSVGSSGSALPVDSYFWVRDHVGATVRVNSTTGGTDIVSAFAGGSPIAEVWPGELSVACLGVALDSWDSQGLPVRDEVGELVVTKPMPSMPIFFWNDTDGSRYREAYFDTYPGGVWRHGDWITITDRGSVIVHGRSDSTLNRNGIRMGSADIYQVVEQLPEIAEALVVGAEQRDGTYWMPLFVVLKSGVDLTDALAGRIRTAIREQASPKHVPDDIIAVPAIPHTRTGKKLEIPIKRLLQGARLDDVADSRSVDDPASLVWFAEHQPLLGKNVT